MTAQAVLALVLQILALFNNVSPAIVQAIKDFEMLFADGKEPTQEQIDDLLNRVRTQSVTIQNQPD